MYRVLLVEDEATVREGIVQKIRWEDHGFQLAGACENGKQAIELLRLQSVDVIITDINMPVMDGLSLAQLVRDSWPEIRVVILTGFGDFSYAQSAIRSKVHEYILKPVTAKQLRELLDKLCRELDESMSSSEQTRAVMGRNLLERMLIKEQPREEIEQQMREFSLALRPGSCCATVLEAFGDTGRLQKATSAAADGKGELVLDGLGRPVLLCSGSQPAKQAEEIARAVVAACDQPVSAVIGCTVAHLGLLYRSYDEARQGWEHLYRMEPGGVWLAAEILGAPDSQLSLSAMRRAVLREVKVLSRESANRALDDFIGVLAVSSWPRDRLLSQLQKLAILLAEYAEEQRLDIPEGILETLRSQPNLTGAHRCLAQYTERLIQAAEQQGDSSSRQGTLAVEYIKEHYQEPELSLQQITAYLSVSTSYFSVMFKHHTGETFVEFLTRLRMNKAQELILATDKKNYEVAAEVGYDDPGYFRSSFKKFTGLSPSEFRKKNQG